MTTHPTPGIVAAESDLRDPLTGLLSGAQAERMLKSWQAPGSQHHIHALLIALGEVGSVNIAFGKQAGDSVLVEMARRITHFADDELARQDYLAARIDGGSFLLATRDACTRERWQWLAEALADALSLPFRGGEAIGTIRLWPRLVLARNSCADGTATLLDKLAEGLAQAKQGGAARISWMDATKGHFGPVRRRLERDLLSAIDRDEIGVVYQPQYDSATNRLIGAEALARWNHSALGQFGAATLFTLAERADQVALLSRHIIGRALSQAAEWPEPLRLSVNVTATCLGIGGFGTELVRLAQDAGFPLSRLTVEITEQMLIGDMPLAQATLGLLRDQGVSVALDDFGAGFCNFRYLQMLPLDLLKLDRTMIETAAEDNRALAVLRGMIAMADALGLKVVVEGVEDEAQLAIIKAEGCAYYQGFLRSPAVSNAELLGLAAKRL